MLDREQLAKIIYEVDPYCVSGEYVDGFAVSPGGPMSWEQVKAWDAEFDTDIANFPYRCADAIITRQRRALEGELQEGVPEIIPTVLAGEPVNVPHDGYIFGVDEYGKHKVFVQLDVTHLKAEAVDTIRAAVATCDGGIDNGRADDAEPAESAGDHAIH